MKNRKKIYISILIIFLMPVSVFCVQNNDLSGNFGMTASTFYDHNEEFNYQLWIGVIWHPTSFLSIRPSVMIFNSDNDETNNLSSTVQNNKNKDIGARLGLYYYIRSSSRMKIYFGPCFSYMTEVRDILNSDGSTSDRDESLLTVSLKLGAHFQLSKHVAVMADFGIGWNQYKRDSISKNSGGTITSETHENETYIKTLGAVVSVAFYF